MDTSVLLNGPGDATTNTSNSGLQDLKLALKVGVMQLRYTLTKDRVCQIASYIIYDLQIDTRVTQFTKELDDITLPKEEFPDPAYVLARVVLEFYQANGCNVALDSLVVTGVSGCVNSLCS